MTQEEKIKALNTAIAHLEKTFGKGTIMKLDETASADVDAISTGCLGIDIVTGIGGLPRGRIIEIYGPESSGKTTLALQAVAQAQKLGGIAAFVDAEHALDPIYAEKLGVDLKNLYVSQPDTGEQGLEIAEELVKSGSIDIVVIDSVAALAPKAEIDGEIGDSFVGLQARLMSQALRKITGIVKKSNTCVIFINQLREKVGNIGYGSPETTAGGRALKFYASMRIDVRAAEQIKGTKDESPVGKKTKIKITKNKLAAPFKVAEVDMLFGEGISALGSIFDLAIDADLIQKSGSWFSYKDEKIGQGRDRAMDYLRKNPEITATLEDTLRAANGLKPKTNIN